MTYIPTPMVVRSVGLGCMMLRNIATVALLPSAVRMMPSGTSTAVATCGLYHALWSRRENPFGSWIVSNGHLSAKVRAC